MALTVKDVEHIASLAKISLTEEEKEMFSHQLTVILGYAAELQEVDTDDIPPTATVLPVRNVMRDDVPEPSLTHEEVLANAPDPVEGFFRVKSILGRPS